MVADCETLTMNTLDDIFSFELSVAELHWLAGAFAMTRLPLPEDPSRFLTAEEWKLQLAQAPATLQEHGFLTGSAQTGWQVDRLPGAIVRWLGSARTMLRLDVYASDGSTRCANIFSEGNACMQLILTGNAYKIVLFPDRIPMINHFLERLGISQIESPNMVTKYQCPQPLIIMATAWKDLPLATKMLMRTGLRPEDIQSTLAWAGTLDWIASLSPIQLNENIGTENQTILCGSGHDIWLAETGQAANDIVVFSPIDLEGIRNTIRHLM